jgi:ubiquitin C-terminal hydrolase
MGSKVRARIAYDENCIDMSEWVSWAALGLPQQYRVVSTIEHLGSSRGGHYVMRAKEADDWYVYDDSRIASCKEGGAAGPDTYILFLQKI